MPAKQREGQRSGESDKEFEKREAAHWRTVAENEKKLLEARAWAKKRMEK